MVAPRRRIAVVLLCGALSGLVLGVLAIAAAGGGSRLRAEFSDVARTSHVRFVTRPLAFVRVLRAENRGRRDARGDLARGDLRLKVVGLQAPYFERYRSKVVNEYGVGIDRAAGRVFDDEMSGYVRGYNSVSWPVINLRFGVGTLEQASNDAQAEWSATEATHAKDRAVKVDEAITTTGARKSN